MLIVGKPAELEGDVTTLNWIGAKDPGAVEEALGYHRGRLSKGYWIALLVKALEPEDFTFGGTTLRSGGRYGLPGQAFAEDSARARVHDDIMAERGADGYAFFQKAALRDVAYTGARRIAKVVPVTRHAEDMAPARQYPMGGGGLQWRLVRKCRFFVAAFVDPDGNAETPEFTANIVSGDPEALYAAKHKLRTYLENA